MQFVNNEDDRVRGEANNPLSAAANKLRPTSSANGAPPFPGDVAISDFAVYKNRTLTKHVGTATYTCYYNYAKHALASRTIN